MEPGEQFVMTLGTTLMLEWSALRWDTPDEVCYINLSSSKLVHRGFMCVVIAYDFP